MKIEVLELYAGRAVGIERVLQDQRAEYELVRLYDGQSPLDTNTPLIISGGAPSLLEKEGFPYLDLAVSYVEGAVEKKRAILGICLGHQVLAQAIGGEIRRSKNPEVGFHKIHHNTSSLTEGIASPSVMFSYHVDEVVSLPERAQVFSRSKGCSIQGFQLGDKNIYGVQYHPEVNLDLAKQILNGSITTEDAIDVAKVTSKDLLGDKTLTNFLRHIQ